MENDVSCRVRPSDINLNVNSTFPVTWINANEVPDCVLCVYILGKYTMHTQYMCGRVSSWCIIYILYIYRSVHISRWNEYWIFILKVVHAAWSDLHSLWGLVAVVVACHTKQFKFYTNRSHCCALAYGSKWLQFIFHFLFSFQSWISSFFLFCWLDLKFEN